MKFIIQFESFIVESQTTRFSFSDFWGVCGPRSPSQQFSITAYHSLLSIGSPTSLPPSAHVREIRKLISFIRFSMNPDSHCKSNSINLFYSWLESTFTSLVLFDNVPILLTMFYFRWSKRTLLRFGIGLDNVR